MKNFCIKLFQFAVLTTSISVLFPLPSARAELVQQSDPRFGPNSITLDTRTGLAWLDLTYSVNMSYQQGLAATQPGGAFEGYRYASADEIFGLFSSAGIPGPGLYATSSPTGQSILSLISLIGATANWPEGPVAVGISGTPLNNGRDVPGLVPSSFQGTFYYGAVRGQVSYNESAGYSPETGNWFVAVPEPSGSLLGLAAGTFLWRRRRRRQ